MDKLWTKDEHRPSRIVGEYGFRDGLIMAWIGQLECLLVQSPSAVNPFLQTLRL